MKKLAKNLLFIFVVFMVSGLGLMSCGNPYRNLKMEIVSSSVTFNEETNRNEFVLTSSSSTFTLTARVTGGDASIDRSVDISIEQPSDVIEFLTTDGESVSHSGEETSASFIAKNGGYATINFISKEGGLKQSFKVFVVIPINELSFGNENLPILKGKTTNITEELLNGTSAYDYLNFLPANTNQKDSIKFEFVNNTQVNGVVINGTKITVGENSNVDSFQIVARYKNEAGEEKVTNPATFKVLTLFDLNKLQIQNLTLNSKPSLEYDKANGYYVLKLSTNYEESCKASLAFMYDYGKEKVNALNYLYISEHLSTSTKYSIKTEKEKDNSSLVSSSSNFIDVSKVTGENGGVFNIVHKNIIAPEIVKFYVNFLGFESYFEDIVISLQVEVSPFPEDIGVYESENGKEIGSSDSVYVYNTYSNKLAGTPIFVSVLGPDRNQLDLERFTCEILDDNGELEFVQRKGSTYEKVSNGAVLQSGTQLYLRTVNSSTSITDCRVRFKSVTMGEIYKEINIKIVPDDVKWSTLGDSEATIYLDFLSTAPITFNFLEVNNPNRNPSWIGIDGQVDSKYSDLKIDNFKFSNSDNEIIEIGNKTLTGFSIKVLKVKLGSSVVTVQTPNGYVFKLTVKVLMNLKSENLVAELGSYADKEMLEIKEKGMYDNGEYNEYSALVGNKQTVAIKFKDGGLSYTLDINKGYTSYRILSSAPESVLVQSKNIIAKNISAYKTEIEITIRGYSWEEDNLSQEPSQKEFKFIFYVHVKSLIGSVKTTSSNPSIFTFDTLNIDEKESKGTTKVSINIAPVDVKSKYEITWNLLNKLNGDSLLSSGDGRIGKNNKSGEVVLEGNSISVVITYLLSDDLTTLTLTTRLRDNALINKYVDFSSYFYVYAYVQESYEDFYGNSYQSGFSNHTRITVANAKLVSEIIPDVAMNKISFDKREFVVKEIISDRVYFEKNDKNTFEFSYSLNPLNPENKNIALQIFDASIDAEVDNENQIVKVWIVSLPVNSSYTAPSFVLRLCAIDSAMGNNDYAIWKNIDIEVQDGLEVPYEIATEDDLIKLSNNTSAYAENYILANNITLSSSNFKPIGSIENPFTGSFVGSTRFGAVPSISIELNNVDDLEFIGLFGVTKGAKIENVAIKNIKINLNATSENVLVGSLVALAIDTEISNCYIDDGNGLEDLSGQKVYALSNNQNGININAGSDVKNVLIGGLAGATIGGKIINPSVKVKISTGFAGNDGLNVLAGGVVGFVGTGSSIEFEEKDSSLSEFNVYACINPVLTGAGNVSSTSKFALGGVAGLNLGEISFGQIRAFIYGNNNIGGIAGVNAGSLQNMVVQPTLIGSNYIGGAVGTNLNGEGVGTAPLLNLSVDEKLNIEALSDFYGEIENVKVQFVDNDDIYSYFNTGIYGSDAVGGLVGLNITNANDSGSVVTLTNAIRYSSVYSYVDREIASANYSKDDRNKLYFGDIVVNLGTGYVAGGLVGRAKNLVLENCYANVKFNVYNPSGSSDKSIVGGALGGLQGEENKIAIVMKNVIVDGYYKDENLFAGGFIGDASGIMTGAKVTILSGDANYSTIKTYKCGSENYGAYNIINSYSLLKVYGGNQVVQNFAGVNEYKTEKVEQKIDLVKFERTYFDKTEVTNLTEAKVVVKNILGLDLTMIDSGVFANAMNGYKFVIDDAEINAESFDGWCTLLSNLQYKLVLTIKEVGGKSIATKVQTLYYTAYENLPSYAKLGDGGLKGNFSNAISSVTLSKEYKIPNVVTLNSYYIGFETYILTKTADGVVISENVITIDEALAKNGSVSINSFKAQTNGDYIAYLSAENRICYIRESDALRCDENGIASNTGKFIKIAGKLYYYENVQRFNRVSTQIKLYQDNVFFTNLIVSNIKFYSNFVSSSWNMAIINSVDNETGWDKTNGKPDKLEDLDYYLSSETNNGFPLLLGAEKEKNGKVQFIIDLPPKNLSVECGYVDKTYPSEGETEIGTIVKVIETEEIKEESYDALTNKVIAKKVQTEIKEDEITLSYYSVDTNRLPLRFGYYDFNHDGNLEKVTQNEKIFTAHLNALITLKNRYLLSDLVKAVATPSFISSSELNIKSNSNLVAIVNEDGKNYLIVKGTGVAELTITSKLNSEFSKKIRLNIINAISNVEIYKDSSRTTLLGTATENSIPSLNIIKNSSAGLYFGLGEYLTTKDGVDKTLIKLYGNVPLENNTYFDFGVRFYILSEDGIYHEGLNGIPDGFSINNQLFKLNAVEGKGNLIYVDCDNASEAVISGLSATTYSLMAVPYVKIDENTRVLIYKEGKELSEKSGDRFNINILNGTKSLSTIIDSETNPFSPSSFETTITTDNANAKLYISVQNDKNKFMELKSFGEVGEGYSFETVDSIHDDFTGKDIDAYTTDKGTSTLSGSLVYELPQEDNLFEGFIVDKFRVSLTSIVRFDKEHNAIENETDYYLTKYIKYSFTITVLDEYKYYITKTEKLKFSLFTLVNNSEKYGDSDGRIETVSFDYSINPQDVEKVTLSHYADITLQSYDVVTGKPNVITGINQSFISNTLVCGQPGLLHINIHPGYSKVDSLTISSNVVNGYSISLEQMYANYISNQNGSTNDKYLFGGYYTSIADDNGNVEVSRTLGLKQISFGYQSEGLTNFEYNGNYYVKTSIPTFNDASIKFELSVVGYTDGKKVIDEKLIISPQLTPDLEFTSNGQTDRAVAIGTEVELTVKTNGTLDESKLFNLTVDKDVEDLITGKSYSLQDEAVVRYIYERSISRDNDGITYRFYIPYNRDIIGEEFSLEVTSYKIINNNRYESKKKVSFIISEFVVNNVLAERVEQNSSGGYELNGNYNQEYALRAVIDASYVSYKDLTGMFGSSLGNSNDEIVAKADTILANIRKDIAKMEALITSKGLFGEYISLEDLIKTEGADSLNLISTWQNQASNFGETEILTSTFDSLAENIDKYSKLQNVLSKPAVVSEGYYQFKSAYWKYVGANGLETLSVDGNSGYNGIQITNARASRINTGISVPTGKNTTMELLEPYATLNVRVTNINTTAKIALCVQIAYGKDANGKTCVGLIDNLEENRKENKYSEDFECEFGFNAIQLSNEENPEPIYTVEELKNMQAGGHYILMEDLELEYWEPLNTAIASLDGNEYVLRLKSFNDFRTSGETNIGLFGTVSENTLLKNIILEVVPANRNFDDTAEIKNSDGDINVLVNDLSKVKFGLIAGENKGTITNAYITYDADSYREERDGLVQRTDKSSYYSEYKKQNPLLDASNRTTSIVKVSSNVISSSEDIRIGGVIGVNSGFVTNSAIENISIIGNIYVSGFACENASGGKISSSYFKGGNIYNISEKGAGTYASNGTAGFTIFNSGEINYSYVYGREITSGELDKTPNISGITADTVLENNATFGDRYVGLRYTYNSITNGTNAQLKTFLNEQTDFKLDYTNMLNQRAIGAVINSAGNASGFVYSNSGVVTNSYSNILILASGSSGFVFANNASASINNSFTLSSVQTNDTYHKPFTGVVFEGSTSTSLNNGDIENSYYLQVNNNDYQQLFDIYNALHSMDTTSDEFKEKYGELYYGSENQLGLQQIFSTTGSAGDGEQKLEFVVNGGALFTDPFGSGDSTAIGLSSIEFSAYTSFATYSFNSDYALNGTEDNEKLASAVWFIPTLDTNEASENTAIAKYFKHSSYTSRVPQLVSANLKTMSLRKANFIPQLPSNSDMKEVLETLSSDMGYARVKSRLLESGDGYPGNGVSNKEIFIGLIGNGSSASTNENENYICGYANQLGEAIINAYISVKNPLITSDLIISGNNTIQNIMNNYFINRIDYTGTVSSAGASELSDKDILEILIVAINSINAIDETSDSSYTYSYVQKSSKDVNIIYGESVLNPYLITSAEKFNVYSLQINSLGEETTLDQDAYLRFVKDIYFDNVLQSVKTYKLTFRGDLEGNGMTIQDLKIVAENEKVQAERIEEIGLFKVLKGEEDGLRGASVRNLNLDIDTISATAVKYVGALAGRIEGGDIENIQILGDDDSIINGFNATGGLTGKISGRYDKENNPSVYTIVTNIKSSVSVKSNMYTGPANRYSSKTDDPSHRFNLYTYSYEIVDEKEQYISNIDEVSYAGGIAGILEADYVDLGNDVVSNANIRSNQVTGNVTLRGEVVGGLFGYVGKNSLISNSKLVVSENTRIVASAIGGGLVGHLEGDITSSEVTHAKQTSIDAEIYNKVQEFDPNNSKSTISLKWGVAQGDSEDTFEGENTALFGATSANAHYIGGLAGLTYGGDIAFSYNRVDVASINSKFAGGLVGLSIGISLKDVYTTSSVFSFVSYGGIIGLQTMQDINGELLDADKNNDYYIKNWKSVQRENVNTTISLSSVVGANLWKEDHKVVNRKTYRIDAFQAEIGAFIGRAMSYNTQNAYCRDKDEDGNPIDEWYDSSNNPTNQRVKSESVYFMMAFAKSNTERLILEIGNATSVKAVLGGKDDLKIIGEYQGDDDREKEYLVRNLTKYTLFGGSTSETITYAYSGDFSSKLKNAGVEGNNDEDFNYYRFSRLANYGSFRTIKEIINGKYMLSETRVGGLTARIYDKQYINQITKEGVTEEDLNSHYIERNSANNELGEYDLTKLLIDVTADEKESSLSNKNSSRTQNIYDNWRQDAWFGVSMSDTTGIRSENQKYVFPRVRTKVYEDVIYVQTIFDLVNNTNNYPSKTYVLLNDINMDDYTEDWEPLNNGGNAFSGVIKSYNNSKIYNVRAPIFANADGATFKDFGIETANRAGGISYNGDNFGVLVNSAKDTKFMNLTISVTAGISTRAQNVGGMVGLLEGDKSRIEQVIINFTSGALTISRENANAGLVVGHIAENSEQIVVVAGATGNIALNGDKNNASVGGLIGKAEGPVYISGYAQTNIVGGNVEASNIGGFIGYGRSIVIYSSATGTGNISLNNANNSNIGGLVGYFEGLEQVENKNSLGIVIQKSVNNLNLIVKDGYGDKIGGLVGAIKSNDKLTDSVVVTYSSGSISAKPMNGSDFNTIGGLFGSINETLPEGAIGGDGITIESSYSLSKIGVLKEEANVGGIIGEYLKNGNREDGKFKNICYVYDFVPNFNGYGSPRSYQEFVSGELSGLNLTNIENAEWVEGSNNGKIMTYPIIKDMMLALQTSSRNNQHVVITADKTELSNNNYSAICYTGTSLPNDWALSNKTIYLLANIQQDAKTVTLDNLSVVIGLKDGGITSLTNNGIISEANVNNLQSFNGVFIKSRITTEDKNIFDNDKTMYNSYMVHGSSYDYRNDKNQQVKFDDIKNIDLKAFLNDYEEGKNQAQFDFDSIWALNKNRIVELRWLISLDQTWINYQEDYTKTGSVYEIATASELAKFANDWNNGTIKSGMVRLTADIDLSDYIWTPIGTVDKPFSAKFDGNNKRISGINVTNNLAVFVGNNVTKVSENNVGLFGYISNAIIQNLNLTEGIIFATGEGSSAGAVIGSNRGASTLTRVQVLSLDESGSERVRVYGDVAGGMIGTSADQPHLKECAFEGMVYGETAGGFVGSAKAGVRFTDCYVSNGNIKNTINARNIEGKINSGALFGYAENNFNVWVDGVVYITTEIERLSSGRNVNHAGINGKIYTISNLNLAGDEKVKNIDSNTLQTSNTIEGFKFGQVWCRVGGKNNGYPVYFDYWIYGAKVPEYEEYYNADDIQQAELDRLDEFKNKGIINITLPSELAWISRITMKNAGTFEGIEIRILKDLSFSTKVWNAIGSADCPFKGTMYGYDSVENKKVQRTISNLTVNDGGLFNVTENATIEYIHLSNTVSASLDQEYAGLLICNALGETTISQVISDGNLTLKDTAKIVGGLIGNAVNITLKNCTNNTKINYTKADYIGGLVGNVAGNLIIENCTNSSTLTGGYVGGLVASVMGKVEIKNSTNSGKISATQSAGGLVAVIGNASNANQVVIENCTNEANVSSSGEIARVGGLVGDMVSFYSDSTSVSIKNCKNTGSITGKKGCVGGLIGMLHADSVVIEGVSGETTNSGVIRSSGGTIGSIAGSIDATKITLTNLRNSASVVANGNYVGGLVGYMSCEELIANNLTNSGTILSGNGVNKFVGGIFGLVGSGYEYDVNTNDYKIFESNLNKVELTNIVNAGNVIARNSSYVGGIAGSMVAKEVQAKDIKNSGNTQGQNYIGGLFGYVQNITIQGENGFENEDEILYNEFEKDANGDFVLDENTGYRNIEGTSTIQNYYKTLNSGMVQGANYVGGFIGLGMKTNVYGKQVGSSVYYLRNSGEVAGNSYVGGIVGKLNHSANSKDYFEKLSETESNSEYKPDFNYEENSLKYLINEGKITANSLVGGIAGDAVSINEVLVNKGIIQLNGASVSYAGGIFGSLKGKLNIAKNLGNIINEENASLDKVGGIIGDLSVFGELKSILGVPTWVFDAGITEVKNLQNLGSLIVDDTYTGALIGMSHLVGTKTQFGYNNDKIVSQSMAGNNLDNSFENVKLFGGKGNKDIEGKNDVNLITFAWANSNSQHNTTISFINSYQWKFTSVKDTDGNDYQSIDLVLYKF